MQQLTVQQHILDPERPSSSLNMLDTLTYLIWKVLQSLLCRVKPERDCSLWIWKIRQDGLFNRALSTLMHRCFAGFRHSLMTCWTRSAVSIQALCEIICSGLRERVQEEGVEAKTSRRGGNGMWRRATFATIEPCICKGLTTRRKANVFSYFRWQARRIWLIYFDSVIVHVC